MRGILISLAAVGAAVAVASPAAAQYYPQQYGYNGYNNYGYNDYGQVRAMQIRLNRIERQAERFGSYNGGYAVSLQQQARRLEYRLDRAARSGLNPYEANDLQARIGQLEQQVRYLTANSYGRGYDSYNGYDRGYGYQNGRGQWGDDRDQDDRDDD